MDGFTQTKKMVMNHGSAKCYKKGGLVKDDVAVDKKIAKKAIGMHDDQLHGGKETNLTSLKKGGKAMKSGGSCYKKGGMVKKDKSMKKSMEMKSSTSAPKNLMKALPTDEPVMAPASPLGGSPPMLKKGGKMKSGGMMKSDSKMMKSGGKAMKSGGKMKKGGMMKKADGGVIGGMGGMGAMSPQDLMMLKKKLAMMGQQGAGAPPMGGAPAGGPPPMGGAGAPPMAPPAGAM